MLGAAETLPDRRVNWPIFEAAERHGMPVALQVTSGTRFAPGANGWPTYLFEDHVSFARIFQSQLLSMIAEGVFNHHPGVKVVLLNADIGWVPSFV